MMRYSFFHIDEAHREEWEAMVKGNGATSFLQSFAWAEFCKIRGVHVYKIGMKRDGKFVGGVVMMKYNENDTTNYFYAPSGPVIDYTGPHAKEDFEAMLKEMATLSDTKGESLTSHIIINPLIPTIPKTIIPLIEMERPLDPDATRIVDLSKSEEQIFSEMESKCRGHIRGAIKKGVRVYEDTSVAGQKIFLETYALFKERKGYKGKSQYYFETMLPLLISKKMATVLIAEHEGKPIAVRLYVGYGDTFTDFYAPSTCEKKDLGSQNLILWEAIRLAKRQGYAYFDMCGVTRRESDTSSPWYGFSQFKKSFGGTRLVYAGAFAYVVNQERYDSLPNQP